jgi:uncharacterized membrane protein
MNRQTFLSRLREGLSGLPPTAKEDILADYAAHFAEAESAGRSDVEVAQALGDPDRLARELKAEQGLRRWEEERNPNAAVGAIFAVLGLATIDILILLPILLSIGGALFGLFIGAIGCFFAGSWVFVSGAFGGGASLPFDANPLGGALIGLGMMSGSIAFGALLMLVTTGLVNLLVRYARLHYRLLKPAVES